MTRDQTPESPMPTAAEAGSYSMQSYLIEAPAVAAVLKLQIRQLPVTVGCPTKVPQAQKLSFCPVSSEGSPARANQRCRSKCPRPNPEPPKLPKRAFNLHVGSRCRMTADATSPKPPSSPSPKDATSIQFPLLLPRDQPRCNPPGNFPILRFIDSTSTKTSFASATTMCM